MSDRLTNVAIAGLLGLALLVGLKGFDRPRPVVPSVQPAPAPVRLPRRLTLFTTTNCAPCATMKAILGDPALRKGWDFQEKADRISVRAYRVTSFPTLVAEDGNKELGRVVGAKSAAELQAWLAGLGVVEDVEAQVAGSVAPDGTTEIHCDLPGDLHCHNVSSRGEGCCVQTSINHSARWQNVPALVDFHKWVQEQRLPGGAYPGAVDERIPACCKDRGFPVVEYLQVQGGDLEILKAACRSGRMPGVTYSKSPTGRYNGKRISHMVSLVHADDNWFCVLDNNYEGDKNYEWMTPEEFKKTYSPGWAVILLSAPPPPPPTNPK